MNAAYEKLIQHLDEHDIRYLTSADRPRSAPIFAARSACTGS